MRPLVVVEASERAFAAALRRLEGGGSRVVDGWNGAPGVVCAGAVESADDAGRAVLAAVRGAGVVVHCRCDRETADRLVDDLRRLGPVEHHVDEPEQEPRLTTVERRLLEHLADGRTLGEAAEALHLSRRTADRRLASARQKLAASTTAEAIVALGRGP